MFWQQVISPTWAESTIRWQSPAATESRIGKKLVKCDADAVQDLTIFWVEQLLVAAGLCQQIDLLSTQVDRVTLYCCCQLQAQV